MPLAVVRYLQARDILTFGVQGGTMGSSGITWGSAVELALAGSSPTATFKAFEVNSNPDLKLFMPSDSGVGNYQNEYEDYTVTAREIIPANGAGALAVIWAGYDYVRYNLVWRPRYLSTGAGIRIVAVGTRADFRTAVAQGENLNELTIRPCGYAVYQGTSTDTPPI